MSSIMSSTQCVGTYAYRPLNTTSKEIRLLEVHPGQPTDEIACSVHHASLNNPSTIQYETVSYCWGDSSLRSTITVDSTLISVPTSSAQALRTLRRTDKARTLWIDAICINQNDIEEKGQQVAMMSEIYRGTTRGLVFLGENAGDVIDVSHVLEEFRRILRVIRRETEDYKTMLKVLYDKDDAFQLSASGLGIDIDSESLIQFYSVPW